MRGATTAVVAVIVCLLAQGCGTLIASQWPKKSKRAIGKRTGHVALRAAPAGAVVTTADGKTVLGPAPRELAAEYDVVLEWKERSMWGPIVGGTVAAGWLGYSVVTLFTDKLSKEAGAPYSRFWLGMTIAGTVDLFGVGTRVGSYVSENKLVRREPKRAPVPLDVTYQVVWDGFDPVDITVRFPNDTRAVATRPTEVTFDQAIVHWERSAQRSPTPAAMLNLGAAYLARARARADAADAAKAVTYLEGYLASTDVAAADRSRAEAMLAEAKEMTR